MRLAAPPTQSPSMQSSSAIRDLVLHLLTHESGERQAGGPESLVEAAERVCEKLRAHLSRRVGQDGFRTLLARALTLAAAQFPHLHAVRIGAGGAMEGLHGTKVPDVPGAGTNQAQGQARQGESAEEETVEGVVSLLAHLFGLLVTFIGGDLMLRMLRTVWPTLHPDNTLGKSGDAPGREEETR